MDNAPGVGAAPPDAAALETDTITDTDGAGEPGEDSPPPPYGGMRFTGTCGEQAVKEAVRLGMTIEQINAGLPLVYECAAAAADACVHSCSTHQRLPLTFRNCTPHRLCVQWLDYTGAAVTYGLLAPHGSPSSHMMLYTFKTHPWRVVVVPHNPDATRFIVIRETQQQVAFPSSRHPIMHLEMAERVPYSFSTNHKAHCQADPGFAVRTRELLRVHNRLRSHPELQMRQLQQGPAPARTPLLPGAAAEADEVEETVATGCASWTPLVLLKRAFRAPPSLRESCLRRKTNSASGAAGSPSTSSNTDAVAVGPSAEAGAGAGTAAGTAAGGSMLAAGASSGTAAAAAAGGGAAAAAAAAAAAGGGAAAAAAAAGSAPAPPPAPPAPRPPSPNAAPPPSTRASAARHLAGSPTVAAPPSPHSPAPSLPSPSPRGRTTLGDLPSDLVIQEILPHCAPDVPCVAPLVPEDPNEPIGPHAWDGEWWGGQWWNLALEEVAGVGGVLAWEDEDEGEGDGEEGDEEVEAEEVDGAGSEDGEGGGAEVEGGADGNGGGPAAPAAAAQAVAGGGAATPAAAAAGGEDEADADWASAEEEGEEEEEELDEEFDA